MTFVKGQSGNPTGRPKASLCLTDVLRSKLQGMAPGEKYTYAELFIQNIIEMATLDRDPMAIRLIMNYVDGLPQAAVNLTGDINWNVVIESFNKNNGHTDPPQLQTSDISDAVISSTGLGSEASIHIVG